MTLLWLVTGAALVAALAAWRQARATARRVDQLSRMYWGLEYQHRELRVRFQQLTGGHPPPAHDAASDRPDGFVPLSSLKR